MTKQYNCGLYLRLSVEDAANSQKRGKINILQTDSSSIENQRLVLSEYAALHGWNVAQTYADDGYSGGAFDNRPAFQQMVKDAEAGLINLVLVQDLSRFGRDYIETGRYTDEVFPRLGVRFIALMDNIDSEGNDDLLPFRSILNDYHLKDLSRKVKSVLRAKAEKGEYIGAREPYGFIKDPANKNRLLIDDYAADVVRRIFGMRMEGSGFAKIAATLNNEGIESPITYRNRRAGIEKPPKMWTACVIKGIIDNESYIGHAVRFKTGYLSYKNRMVINRPEHEWVRCDNAFPQIIIADVWEATRNIANRNAATDDAAHGATKPNTVETDANPKAVPYKSLFRKLLRCVDCGGAMIHKKSTYTSRVTGEKYVGHAYMCSVYDRTGGSVCSRHTIRESVLIQIIREDVQNQLELMGVDFAGDGVNSMAEELQKLHNGASLDEAKKRLGQLSAQLGEMASAGRKLYEDRLKGVINIDTFISLSEAAENDKVALKAEHEQLSQSITSAERRMLEISDIIPKLREFLSLETMTHETVSALVERIVVSESEGRSRHRTHKVEIVYRFEAVAG